MTSENSIIKVKWVPLLRVERAEPLGNPYCGLYSIYKFYAHSKASGAENITIEETFIDPDQQLCLVQINLFHYNDRPLSDTALGNIEQIFRRFASEGKQMIVRFLYDWDGKGISSEPEDISIILIHMDQLSPLLKAYAREIYILQGLFVGSWGEMHDSRYLGQRNIIRLAEQLHECSGEETQIALRCPSFWRMVLRINEPLNKGMPLTEIRRFRFSLFNDAITASETDLGTYGNVNSIDSENYDDKWVRNEELEFQNELCKYVSNGGEVINENPYNDIRSAVQTLRRMRVSYLNSQYDGQVLNKWKSEGAGIFGPLWKNKTGFEYISAHLGYRFAIKDVDLFPIFGGGNRIQASVKIVNKGFAPCYHKFDVKFVLRTPSFSEIHEYGLETDTKEWLPEEEVKLEKGINISGLKEKNYMFCIGIYDLRSERFIALANVSSSRDYMGFYTLGNLILK